MMNNIEFDHADIFKNIDEIKLSFRRLVNIVPGNGLILFNADDPNCVDVVSAAFSGSSASAWMQREQGASRTSGTSRA